MERALTLITSGTLTIEIARACRGKAVVLLRSMNHLTGKESHWTAFSDTAWGNTTRHYATSARELSKAKFDDIIQGAKEYIVPKSNGARKMMTGADEVIEINDNDVRACLVSEDDDDD